MNVNQFAVQARRPARMRRSRLTTDDGRFSFGSRPAPTDLGAFFVETTRPPGFGTDLHCEFMLDDDVVRCEGFVARVLRHPLTRAPLGFELRLLQLPVATMRQLRDASS